MAIVSVSIVPVGTRTPSLSKYVARALEVLELQKDVTHQLSLPHSCP